MSILQTGKFLFTAITTLGLAGSIYAYDSRLITANSAATLDRGRYTLENRISPGGGLIETFSVGVTNRFQVAVGYGGDNVIGTGSVDWYPWPGAQIKYNIIDRTRNNWKLTTGVDVQGFGGNAPDYRGFLFKSQGFFLVWSRGRSYFSNFNGSVHLGTNLSFEELDKVNWPNFSAAWQLQLNSELAILWEYDFATNQLDIKEESESYWKPHRGFLHLGFHWKFLPGFKAEINLLDIFQQRIDSKNYSWGRELKLTYSGRF